MEIEETIDACYCYVPADSEDKFTEPIESQKEKLTMFSLFCGLKPIFFIDDRDALRTALNKLVKDLEKGQVRTVTVTNPTYIPTDLIRRVMYNTDFKWLDLVGFERRRAGAEFDEFFEKAKRLVLTSRIATVSHLQKQLDLGYARATFLLNRLEDAGVVGPYDPYQSWKTRDILLPNPDEEKGKQ